ncbi:MAG: flagellar hook-length control protein FliK [Halopseudomonas aestusnigri]
MNYYAIDTNRATDTQVASKSQQVKNASQAFADFLNPSSNTKNSTTVNPSLTQDTSLLGNILNKPSWPVERDISFGNAERAIDDAPGVEQEIDAKASNDDTDTRETSEDSSSSDDHEDTPAKDDNKQEDNRREAREDTRQDTEVTEDQSPDGSEADAVAVETTTTTQQAATQANAQTKQSVAAQLGTQTTNSAVVQNETKGDQKQNGNKVGVANVQVKQAEITSKPTSNLIASAPETVLNTQEAKVAAAFNAGTGVQDKAKGQTAVNPATSTNSKGAVSGQTGQAVMAANTGQSGNNTNNQSQNSNSMARAEIGATTGAKPTSAGANASFAQSLTATANSAKTASTVPTQKTLQSMNVKASDQLSIHIKKAVGDNKDSISIKLHPSELGRVDVKLEIVDGSTVKAMISAERPDTLDLLQKDSRMLEKALQEAGLKTDGQSLSFNLKQDGSGQNDKTDNGSNLASGSSDNDDDNGAELENIEQANRSSHDGDLDISI